MNLQQQDTPKSQYRIKNWPDYNAALVKRGSLTVWMSDDLPRTWYTREKTGQRGASRHYSDVTIQCGLVLRELFRTPLRTLEGLLGSLISLMGLELDVPDYTTFCRRQKTLEVRLPRRRPEGAYHLVVDSTGLKVYGEGEWKVRQHGVGKRRQWRKLHLAVDKDSLEVVAVELTENNVGDNEVLPELLSQLSPEAEVASVAADGAYDTFHNHAVLLEHQAVALIPPREGAVEWGDLPDGQPHPRTLIVRECAEKGMKQWKIDSGYHGRSLAENAMYRIKQLFGGQLKNRLFESQQTEAYLRVAVMNQMTQLGMPESYRIPISG